MTEFSNLVRHISEKPGMYLIQRSFTAYAAYLDGFDAACGGGALSGFREWLIRRVDGGNNLVWQRLVQMIISKDDVIDLDSDEAIRAAGAVILEFLAYREEWGLRAIFGEYDEWLRQQDWYDEEHYGLHGQSMRRRRS